MCLWEWVRNAALLEWKISSLGKQNPGWKPTEESLFFLKPRHLGVYTGVPLLARVPWRLAEVSVFASDPELHFESSGKRSALFSGGLKCLWIQPWGLSHSRRCRRAGRLAAGLGAYSHQLWSSWGMCDDLVVWHSTEAPSSQRAYLCLGFSLGPKSSLCFGDFVQFWRAAWSSYVQFCFFSKRVSLLQGALTITL